MYKETKKLLFFDEPILNIIIEPEEAEVVNS